MTTTPSITSIIDCLEKTSDPAVAYFSFTTDESGEHGAIRANKEGLQRYAMELLKKSLELEEKHDGKKLCFPPYEWLVSESGYDLIRSVRPEYASRSEILSDKTQPSAKMSSVQEKRKGCLGVLLLLTISLCTLAAAIRCFS
jgi:hypothetical protein